MGCCPACSCLGSGACRRTTHTHTTQCLGPRGRSRAQPRRGRRLLVRHMLDRTLPRCRRARWRGGLYSAGSMYIVCWLSSSPARNRPNFPCSPYFPRQPPLRPKGGDARTTTTRRKLLYFTLLQLETHAVATRDKVRREGAWRGVAWRPATTRPRPPVPFPSARPPGPPWPSTHVHA